MHALLDIRLVSTACQNQHLLDNCMATNAHSDPLMTSIRLLGTHLEPPAAHIGGHDDFNQTQILGTHLEPPVAQIGGS